LRMARRPYKPPICASGNSMGETVILFQVWPT
jgi:hypothetical protein